MKKPATLLTVLFIALTACSEKGKEPPEETDVLIETEIMTSVQTKLVITETMPAETAETSVIMIPTETDTSEETKITETEASITEATSETTLTASETESSVLEKLSFRIKMTGNTRGELLEDTFFGKKGDPIDIELPKGTTYTENGEMVITLSENAAIMETYPCRIAGSDVVSAEPIRKERFTLTVKNRTESYMIGTLNEYTAFANKGETILINLPEGTKIEVSNIIEIELDDTPEIIDTLLENPDGEHEAGSLQINGEYTLRLITPEDISETAITAEPSETSSTESETEITTGSETSVTERYADISFKVHMTGAYEGELLEDTFFGKTGDYFYIRLDDSYAVMSTPDTNAVITLWNDAYIGITDSLIIDSTAIYSIMPAE